MPADTELHKAAKDGLTDDCKDIIISGADVNAEGAQKRTALHRALGGGFPDCAKLLLDHGADPSRVDQMKRTSLHWAVMAPCKENDIMLCVELLFSAGAGQAMVNVPSKSQSTPLHCAITSGREAIARYLLDAGADPSLQDEDGKTATALAKDAGMKDLFKAAPGRRGSVSGKKVWSPPDRRSGGRPSRLLPAGRARYLAMFAHCTLADRLPRHARLPTRLPTRAFAAQGGFFSRRGGKAEEVSL